MQIKTVRNIWDLVGKCIYFESAFANRHSFVDRCIFIYSDDLQMQGNANAHANHQSFNAQLCTYEWYFASLKYIMWMSIRLRICRGFWYWLFMCHSQNEKIKAEVKGPSEHCGEPQGACETKDLISSYKNVNGSFPHHRGKALRDT